MLLHPRETFAREKRNASLPADFKLLAVALAVWLLIHAGAITIGWIPAALTETGAAIFVQPLWLFVVFASGLVFSFVAAAILLVAGRLLGGTASYAELYHLQALTAAALVLPLSVAALVPSIGGVLVLATGAYAFYLMFLAIKEAHGLSTWRAVTATHVSAAGQAVALLVGSVILGILWFIVSLGAFAQGVPYTGAREPRGRGRHNRKSKELGGGPERDGLSATVSLLDDDQPMNEQKIAFRGVELPIGIEIFEAANFEKTTPALYVGRGMIDSSEDGHVLSGGGIRVPYVYFEKPGADSYVLRATVFLPSGKTVSGETPFGITPRD